MDYISACECQAWHLEVWNKQSPEERKRIPFRCRSWRHEGDCRLWKGAQDFARISEAMLGRDHWLHITLTYDAKEYKDIKALFRLGLGQWARLRKRTQRLYGEYKYIQTWERHRSGYPHCHMAVSCERLYHLAVHRPVTNWRIFLRDHAVACGFGKVGWVERVHTHAAMAGYLSKLSRELTGSGKAYQVPTNAPRHFRRLRASVGLLPPPYSNHEITGILRKTQIGFEESKYIK